MGADRRARNVIRRGKGIFRQLLSMLLGPEEDGVFYINGPETLPAPLSREDLEKILAKRFKGAVLELNQKAFAMGCAAVNGKGGTV